MNEKECPNGCVEGEIYNLGTDKTYLCHVCRGIGWIDLDEICACGAPCVMRKNNVAFCGKEDCFVEKTRLTSGFYAGRSPFGHSGFEHHMERNY